MPLNDPGGHPPPVILDPGQPRRLAIHLAGIVQGVGMRPFVHRLATAMALTGWVGNDGRGVQLQVQGVRLDAFIEALRQQLPPQAQVTDMTIHELPWQAGEMGFAIRTLDSANPCYGAVLAPDSAICEDCLAELFDPANRRLGYPFVNCAQCGPRYSICERLPYERAQTAMAGFALCPDCRHEYDDPTNRRFHAQATCCPRCGPQLDCDMSAVQAMLGQGAIVALQGLGGFHLLCDAGNQQTVARLRHHKQRPAWPLALMALNVASVAQWCEVDAAAQASLQGPQRPIVLLPQKAGTHPPLAANIAPGLRRLGFMLPSTACHYLLFHAAAGHPAGLAWLTEPLPVALVVTSANTSGEPLITFANEQPQLEALADIIVRHDRPMVTRLDDSVVQPMSHGQIQLLRRARGFLPQPIALRRAMPTVLGLGGLLKNTLCLIHEDTAFVSQHVGDLASPATLTACAQTLEHMQRLLGIRSFEAIAGELHPDCPSWRLPGLPDAPHLAIQHHHAHIAAVLAEHGLSEPALGVALDGFGLGDDGTAWGGELLMIDGGHFQRVGHLRGLPMPGGDLAARQVWRMAAGALHLMGRTGEITARWPNEPQAAMVQRWLVQGRVPLTTSCGRLFDAAAALLGIASQSRYEAEAALHLEALAERPCSMPGLWRLDGPVLDLLPLLEALLHATPAEGAGLFHGTLVTALAEWVQQAALRHGLHTVALAGGCLHNRILHQGLSAALQQAGLRVLHATALPPNDGALSLGQAHAAALQLLEPPPRESDRQAATNI